MNFIFEVLNNLYQIPWLFYTYITIFGIMVGSFLNVVIYRLPVMMENAYKDEYQEYFHPEQEIEKRPTFNLITPRSRCPHCGHKITAWENIPIVSYLFLGGKCKGCKKPISMRYPLVEAFTGVLSFIIAIHFGPSLSMIGALLLTWSLIAISGIDFDKMLIPDEIVFPLLWLGILLNIKETYCTLEYSVYGAVLGYLIPWTFYWIFKLTTKKEGMGYGDFKLFACIGAWFGIKYIPTLIIGSAFIGAVIGIIWIICTRNKTSKQIPFGPYIAVAGFFIMLYGNEINQWYLKMIL
ncbi:MAG: prepilin peptidase [Succinivibrionaceae bacterium]